MSLFPYESQWGDLSCNEPLIEHGMNPAGFFDWASDGYPSEEAYLFWSRNICGLACFRSVLRAWKPQYGDIAMFELIQRAQRWGALVREGEKVGGLYYRPFIQWVQEDFGIQGAVHPVIEARPLLEHIDKGDVVFASVSSEIRYPDRPNARRGGHLVLVHTFESDRIALHNPSGVASTAQDAELDLDTFERFFARRGFTLRKPA